MLDLCTWRCRIGLFHGSVRNVSVRAWPLSPKARQVSEQTVSVSVTDVLVSAVLVVFTLTLLNSFVANVFESVLTMDISTFDNYQVKTSCVTVQGLEAFRRDGSSDIEVQSRSGGIVAVLVILIATNSVFTLRRLILSNDIEKNPGPYSNANPNPNPTDENSTHPDNVSITSEPKEDSIPPSIANQILLAVQQQNEQTSLIRGDLSAIKSELKDVSRKCDEISDRCDRLEQENSKLSATISNIDVDVSRLYEESADRKDATEKLSETVSNLCEEINKMNDELDRLESFSRRDNLRFFGIPQTNPNEDYNMCAKAVVQALNSVDDTKTYAEDDIIRAHRVGQGDPKPTIVKFRNWRDKMGLLQNKDLREKLNDQGIRLANDLTRRQAAIVAQARRDGKSAYFVRGVMTIGPKRTTTRSYAEVTTASRPTFTDNPETNRDRQQTACVSGESPRHVTPNTSSRPSPERDINSARSISCSARGDDSAVRLGKGGGTARADRGNSTRGKPQQTGLKGYLSTRNTPVSDTRTLRSGSSSK